MDLAMHWRPSSFNFRKLIYLPANYYQVINCKEIVFLLEGEIIPWKTCALISLIPPRWKDYQLTVINAGFETSLTFIPAFPSL